MPRIVVSMKPFGSRSPGVTSLAMTPAINPMMIVPRMCSMVLCSPKCRSAHRLANFQAEPHSEGKCLFLRGHAAEQCDRKMAAYHLFELGSAASQLALGLLGAALGLIAWQAPTILYL